MKFNMQKYADSHSCHSRFNSFNYHTFMERVYIWCLGQVTWDSFCFNNKTGAALAGKKQNVAVKNSNNNTLVLFIHRKCNISTNNFLSLCYSLIPLLNYLYSWQNMHMYQLEKRVAISFAILFRRSVYDYLANQFTGLYRDFRRQIRQNRFNIEFS